MFIEVEIKFFLNRNNDGEDYDGLQTTNLKKIG